MIIGIIFLSMIYVILYQDIIGGCLLASLFVFVFISWLAVRRKASKLRVKVSLEPKAASRNEEILLKGDFTGIRCLDAVECEVTYQVRYWLMGQKKVKKERFEYAGRGGSGFQIPLKIDHCDEVHVTVAKIRMRDMTGLFWAEKFVKARAGALIMPDAYPLGLMFDRAVEAKTKNQYEYDGLKEYHPGDKSSRIHWKLLAGKNLLMVKDMEDEKEEKLILRLSLPELEDAFDDFFTVFYSVSKFFLEQEMPQTVRWGTREFYLERYQQYEELFGEMFASDFDEYSGNGEHEGIHIFMRPGEPDLIYVETGTETNTVGRNGLEQGIYDLELF
ncbi:DUF58 domain-containing protein [Anaerostipes sp.]|uniref:DUF58 domain-containing protein n=1 Tax=Anaerostipes sp. TaxID=1872530 RepID=UPI0025BDB8D7|nr:DUF58 domain-containing protein [Anaerostipes sp.]MBS7008721.1 DUF58 domain-containing protein [Anaerostipes sp.]